MVLMAKNSEKNEPVGDRKEVDCRKCFHYPKPNTTGKNEDLLQKTNNWTNSFCGTDECEGKSFTPVDEGVTDGKEQKTKNTNDSKSEE